MKNFKVNKKLLSMLTAFTLMATPVATSADSVNEENTNNNEFELVQQVRNIQPMTMVEYSLGVKNAYAVLAPKINYDGMQADLQCLYYLTNRAYIEEDIEKELINNGIVFETHLYDEMENFSRAINLINIINDYNQSMIDDVNSADELIDASVLCYADADKNLLNNIHMNYFNAFKNGRYYNESFEDNEAYKMLFKQLTTLNAAERKGNADELSVGARWTAQNIYGISTMEMLATDMQEEHKTSELAKYFDAAELNQKQFIVRNDVVFDLNRCIEKPDLQSEAEDYYTLWHFAIDTVHNDIFETFNVVCSKTK